MLDFTEYTYTGTNSTFNTYADFRQTTSDFPNEFRTVYYGTPDLHCKNFKYESVIVSAVFQIGPLAERVGNQNIHIVMGVNVFNDLRDTGVVSHDAMETSGIVGYIEGRPVHITPDDALKDQVLTVVWEPNSTELEQYRVNDYILQKGVDILWQVTDIDEHGTVIIDDTSYRVLTGEQLAHPGRGKSGTIGTLPSIKRTPPPLPSTEEFNDLFGDVLPEET